MSPAAQPNPRRKPGAPAAASGALQGRPQRNRPAAEPGALPAGLSGDSDAVLREIFMQSPAGIALMRGPEHIYELVNQRYRELVAVLTDERVFIGKTVREVLPRLDGQGFFRLLDDVYASGEAYVGTEMPATIETAVGGRQQVFLNFVYQPVRTDGVVSGIFVHAVDVTEQVMARRSAEASEAKLRFMAASLPHKVFTTAPDGHIEYMSPQWQAYTGMSVRHLRQVDTWRLITHPDDYKQVAAIWRRALAKPGRIEFECRTRNADGEYRWHICRADPMFDGDGQVMMWIGSHTDIDDYKRALRHKHTLELKAALLTEQREQLLALNHAKDEFISLASHQLRTPATGVKQYIGMLLQGYVGELSDDQRAYLRTAYESNERQLAIVNDLLQVAQMDTGTLRLQKSRTDLVAVVSDILNDHADRFAARHQTVSFRPASPSIAAWADEDRIRLVLVNLIDNASKYTYPGKRIAITVRRVRRGVSIAVRDQGVGMSDDDVSKLFNKFTRLDNPLSASVGGSGLGLYWSKRIITMHGGTIRVRSAPGKGSTFTVVLPAVPDDRA